MNYVHEQLNRFVKCKTHHSNSLAIYLHIYIKARLLACGAEEEMSGMEEKVIAVMYFFFFLVLNQSVHC